MLILVDKKTLFEYTEILHQFILTGKFDIHRQIAPADLHIVNGERDLQFLQHGINGFDQFLILPLVQLGQCCRVSIPQHAARFDLYPETIYFPGFTMKIHFYSLLKIGVAE